MALSAVAVPTLPGKCEPWKRLRDELNGRWARDCADSGRGLGVRERASLQSTTLGDFVVVTVEGENPQAALEWFGVGNDPFTKWFVDKVR